MQDRTHDGRVLRLLVSVDEYPRECLAIDVARRLSSEDVLERLAFLFVTRVVPEHARSDNGAELTCKAVRDWLGEVSHDSPGSIANSARCKPRPRQGSARRRHAPRRSAEDI